jgi:hypothetical protein
MRFARTIVLLGVGLLWLGFGPIAPLLAAISLWSPHVRGWLRPSRRVLVIWIGAVLALAGAVSLVPDGWVRLPPGPGHLVTPAYDGRPARALPVDGGPPQNPHLAPTGVTTWRGPMGDSPHVSTASYGVAGCRRLSFDTHGRIVTLCGDAGAPVIRVLDPDSLRQLASKDLPERDDSGCPAAFYLDERDRVVVATLDRRLLVVRTDDADGDPDLTTLATVDLDDRVPDDDCVVGLQPDWRGRTWFVSRSGRVGVVDDGRVRVLDLAEEVATPPTVTRDGVYLVTVEALYRIGADGGARPSVAWRRPYDRGSRTKPGQPVRGSGSAPVVLASGLVAITDNADPRMQVVLHRGRDGEEVCRAPVFGDDAGATDGGLVAAGDAVLVQNGYGYRGPHSAVLGRTTPGGLALVDGACDVVWTSDLDAPSAAPAVALASGLAFAYTKPHSWLGVDAWYLSALDLRTGRTVYAVRTGLTVLADSHRGAVTLGPDGSAYVPVLGGVVRVRDHPGQG